MSNVSKKKRLEKLFERWLEKQHNEANESIKKTKIESDNVTKDHFCKDGIVNEKVFEEEKVKVLFISNEANIDDYESVANVIGDRNKCFQEYSDGEEKDKWKGKMKERLCELYNVIVGNDNKVIPSRKAAEHFAFMNINKRGGAGDIGDGKHIFNYFLYYNDEICEEISIINPDIIVWLGCNTYDMCTKRKLNINGENIENPFPFCERNGLKYFIMGEKEIPLVRMWHTSFVRSTITPLKGYDNQIIGKLCAKMKIEMDKYI